MDWVRQEDPDGCGVAVLAMLTGQTFAEVDATVKRDAKDHTVKSHEMSTYLWDRGYFLRRIMLASLAPEGGWPPAPFAPMHYLDVRSPTGAGGHWIAMDDEGGVLDPWEPKRNGRPASFYKVAYEAVGVIPPLRGGR